MRLPIVSAALVLAVAGCASGPASNPGATAAPAATTSTPVASASGTAPAAAQPKTVQEAQKAGYKIVNQNGKTVYCREQMKTGSHVRTETICLTEQELEAVREANKRNLEQMQRAIPPPQGT